MGDAWFNGLKFAYMVIAYGDEDEGVIIYTDQEEEADEEVLLLAELCIDTEGEKRIIITRMPELDEFASSSSTLEERRSLVLRKANMGYYGDKRCKTCGLAEMVEAQDREASWNIKEDGNCGEC